MERVLGRHFFFLKITSEMNLLYWYHDAGNVVVILISFQNRGEIANGNVLQLTESPVSAAFFSSPS